MAVDLYLIQPIQAGEVPQVAGQATAEAAEVEVSTSEEEASEAVVLAEIIKIVLKDVK